MINIIIPLAGVKNSHIQDNGELKYLLRSLDKYLLMDYRVKLYARQLPGWINRDKIDYQIVERYYPDKAKKYHDKKHYENYFDVLHKLWLMSRDLSRGDNFLYMYDDLLLIKPVTKISQLDKKIAFVHYLKAKKQYDKKSNKWCRTVMRAFDLLSRLNRPVYDYETHLPRYFSVERLEEMFEQFPVEQEIIPYAPSTLYFNLFYDSPDSLLFGEDTNIKAGFYGDRSFNASSLQSYPSRDMDQINKAIKDKMWINYNDKGLRFGVLQEWMEKKFHNKSKFEK